jgi:hypothetical protein
MRELRDVQRILVQIAWRWRWNWLHDVVRIVDPVIQLDRLLILKNVVENVFGIHTNVVDRDVVTDLPFVAKFRVEIDSEHFDRVMCVFELREISQQRSTLDLVWSSPCRRQRY